MEVEIEDQKLIRGREFNFLSPTTICDIGFVSIGSVYECRIFSISCRSCGDEKFIQFTAQHFTYIQA